MAKTFTDLWNELKGDIPAMSPFKAKDCVQRAWHDICDSRRWTFLVSEGVLYAPAVISAGTVQVTQFSSSVVGDATAIAAWVAAALPLSGVTMNMRQFRLPGKPIYNITADDGAGTLTLDRPYQETSEAVANYTILRCYFTPPSSDFLRWISVVDPINSYRFRRRNLHVMREHLDRIDPSRSSSGTPYLLAPYKPNSSGVPRFEMYPHPLLEIAYTVAYSRKGIDLAATDTLPSSISDSMLMSGARIQAYTWAAGNAGRFPDLAGTNWFYLRSQEEKYYLGALQGDKRNDEELFLMNWSESEDDQTLNGPVDGSWLQSHDLGLV